MLTCKYRIQLIYKWVFDGPKSLLYVRTLNLIINLLNRRSINDGTILATQPLHNILFPSRSVKSTPVSSPQIDHQVSTKSISHQNFVLKTIAYLPDLATVWQQYYCRTASKRTIWNPIHNSLRFRRRYFNQWTRSLGHITTALWRNTQRWIKTIGRTIARSLRNCRGFMATTGVFKCQPIGSGNSGTTSLVSAGCSSSRSLHSQGIFLRGL